MDSAFAVEECRKQEEMIIVFAKIPMMKEIGYIMPQEMKKQKSVRNNDYLDWIRTLPCIVCTMQAGYIPSMEFNSDPHHIPKKGYGSMGMKTDDTRVIPLCRRHHVQYHNVGREMFEEGNQLDYEFIIVKLQEAYGRSMD